MRPAEMSEHENGKQKMVGGRGFWIAVFAGAVTGAVAALLYAPSRGSEMRRRIGDSAARNIERIADAAESGLSVYGSAANTYGFQIQRLFGAINAGVEEARRIRTELDDERRKLL
jgi:gas vesicle protein